MEDDEDSDNHLCLKCQKLFTSLESYVQHRKEKCVRVKSSTSSIPSYRVVSESELRPDDFFHSLQLQSCSTNNTKSVEKSNVIVKIEEVVLGNKEINEDDEEEEPPSEHTGGKWKPGYRPSKSQSSSSDERFSNDDHDYVIKTVPHKRLKVLAGPKCRKEAFVRKLFKIPQLHCALCKVVFKSREQLVKHLTTSKHWRKRDKDSGEHREMILNNSHLLAPISPFKCGVCPFYFNSHNYLVEHWNTTVEAHCKGEKENQGFRCSACIVTMRTTEAVKAHLLENRTHLEKTQEWHNKCRSVIISTADIIHCPYCDWSGKRQQALNFHIKWKHPSEGDGEKEEPKNGEIYRCSNCSFVAKRQASVLAHERRLHRPTEAKSDETEEPLNDDMDAGEIDDNADTEWMRGEDSKGGNDKSKKKFPKNHTCVHCGVLFGNSVLLLDHVNSVHPDKLFRCDICSVTYELEALFVKHQNSRLHKYHTVGLAENTGDSTGEDHMCDQCEFKSFSKSGLLYHQVMHQGSVGYHSENEQLDENQERVKREKKYRCPVCSEIVKINVLRQHLVAHTGERPYPCQWCQESFMAKVTLASHIRTKHREKKFVCPFCPYRTQRRAKLASHLDVHQQKEARVRKCLCDICGAGFFNRSSLKHHMRLHLPLELGGKTQLCSFPGCRLSFRSPSELVYHTRTHTGERPYLCGNCGYAAKTKHQLTKHERSHNGQRPFKCRHCTYAAALSSQLLRHMRIHTGAKPYSCPYCDYTCNTHENLRKHVLKSKKHVGLSVYKCPHCEFGCNLASELKNHMFNLHSAITEQADPRDSAFSSVVSGIFSRNEDRRDIDHPSTPYTPRTEKPGYREKMRQSWKPKSTADADDIEDLTIVEGEEGAEDETEDIKDSSKHLARFLTDNEQRVIVAQGGDDDHFRGIQENYTVVVEDGDDDLETTSALKRLLESNTIVVPLESAVPNMSSSIPLAVLNNVEMNSSMMEATDGNGATVYLCMPVSP